MQKKRRKVGISQSTKQKQQIKLRYAVAASVFFTIAITGILYLNFNNSENTHAASTTSINTINYRSTNVEISQRYLRSAESINTEGRSAKKTGQLNGKLAMPSRGQDIIVREIQIPTVN